MITFSQDIEDIISYIKTLVIRAPWYCPKGRTAEERRRYFWSLFNPTDPSDLDNCCWIWSRPLDASGGYGYFCLDGRQTKVNRVAYSLVFGPTNLDVLHRCNVRSCGNPRHLYAGTDIENSRDRVAAGRSASNKGQTNGTAKLAESDLPEIVASMRLGESAPSIARRYGVSSTVVYNIQKGRSWTYVTECREFERFVQRRLEEKVQAEKIKAVKEAKKSQVT